MTRRLALALLMACLASCRSQPAPISQAFQPLPEFPFQVYQPRAGASVYRIDSEHSRADIVVRRGGALARFGHDHMVSATHIDGYVLHATDDFKNSRADLRLDLDSLIVDDPLARERYGLDTRPTAQDIENTRVNMRGKVLQTEAWPQVHLNIDITGGTADAPEAQLTVYLHGEQHAVPISFGAQGLGDDHPVVTGTFSLRQSDFGIQPFSVLGGGLQVLDQVDVTFLLLADRIDSSGPIP